MKYSTVSVHFGVLLMLFFCILAASEGESSSSTEDVPGGSTTSQSQNISQCYCDNGTPRCVNNSCPMDPHCVTDIVIPTNTSARPYMRYLCGDHFLTCAVESSSTDSNGTEYTECCMGDSYCNRCLVPSSYPLDDVHFNILAQLIPENCTLPTRPPPTTETTELPLAQDLLPWYYILIIVLAVVLVGALLCLFVVLSCVTRQRRLKIQTDSVRSLEMEEGRALSCSSGAGGTLLLRRTIARDIKRKEMIAKGGYGEVWLGIWKDEKVAVKVFSARDESSWKKEEDVFQTYMLHHENIVNFIAVDKHPTQYGQELWIVMEYCQQGSLFDFLRKTTISYSECQTILLSIASGLRYLHMELETGGRTKPGIAHRDVKSRNILIKNDGSCCITDFGLSLKNTEVNGRELVNVPSLYQGTKRYMAPEVLNGTIRSRRFEAYKQVDIYAFALVMWEVARRCEVNGVADEYQLPYFDRVSHDPKIEEMKQVVVVQMQRPSSEKRWQDSEFLMSLYSMMKECWTAIPNARLSAQRIKKNVANLYTDLDLKMKPLPLD